MLATAAGRLGDRDDRRDNRVILGTLLQNPPELSPRWVVHVDCDDRGTRRRLLPPVCGVGEVLKICRISKELCLAGQVC